MISSACPHISLMGTIHHRERREIINSQVGCDISHHLLDEIQTESLDTDPFDSAQDKFHGLRGGDRENE